MHQRGMEEAKQEVDVMVTRIGGVSPHPQVCSPSQTFVICVQVESISHVSILSLPSSVFVCLLLLCIICISPSASHVMYILSFDRY